MFVVLFAGIYALRAVRTARESGRFQRRPLQMPAVRAQMEAAEELEGKKEREKGQ
ncbi:hypothetical protein D3C81_2140550 [compost metagenome]